MKSVRQNSKFEKKRKNEKKKKKTRVNQNLPKPLVLEDDEKLHAHTGYNTVANPTVNMTIAFPTLSHMLTVAFATLGGKHM